MSDDKTMFNTDNPDDMANAKISDEKETRQKILTVARWAGREKDMLILFSKFDKMRKECSNEDKRKDIAKIGAIEVYRLLGECFAALKQNKSLQIPGLDSHRGELWIGGQLVYKDK